VKLRYRSKALPATLDGEELHLGEPVAGAAPGQAAVLYAGDVIVGSAWIA
jgi:tRNA U34 2-thiouridine synthase MnmA/TrmU